ncbi:hypothetical protein TSMEX_004058 [Taenia solium]|eukprot:TsM_000947300 transcript=TsM_000947300 gene=TsM_000947300
MSFTSHNHDYYLCRLLMETLHCADPKSLMSSTFSLNMANFKNASYKFVETRYAILNSESAPATTMTIPFTISPSTAVGGLRVGLSSPSHLQPPPSNFPSNSPATIAAALPPQSSSPPTITSAVGTAASRFSAQTEPVTTIPERTNTVQGSRRRKATTPLFIPKPNG